MSTVEKTQSFKQLTALRDAESNNKPLTPEPISG